MKADPKRGETLFQQRQCAVCHHGLKAVGPSLEGLSKRYGISDMFRSTVDPSHTISDRYQAKQVLTQEGQVVVGIPIYESVDGVTLITADTKTRRINAEDIARIQVATASLMPEGLLDGMSEQQVADLLAYLRSL
jgi:putative heme-binding domain-containing protein